jgi:NADH-quinone oxidoreductase subunit J
MINWHTIAFYVTALLLLSSAIYFVLTGNIVRSVMGLIFTFLMVAGVYFLLIAEFIAVVQILIYAGAISVLIVFSVMLITDRNENINNTNPYSKNSFWIMDDARK